MAGLRTVDEKLQTPRRPATSGMKWWGWGDEGVSFTHSDKPALAPFIKRHLGLDVEGQTSRPVAFDDLRIPEPSIAPELQTALEAAVGARRSRPTPSIVWFTLGANASATSCGIGAEISGGSPTRWFAPARRRRWPRSCGPCWTATPS